jgi:hypothetical protein
MPHQPEKYISCLQVASTPLSASDRTNTHRATIPARNDLKAHQTESREPVTRFLTYCRPVTWRMGRSEGLAVHQEHRSVKPGSALDASRKPSGSSQYRPAADPGPRAVQASRVYLTGPYKGAPLGLSIVMPVEAGHFNLGNLIVRAKIESIRIPRKSPPYRTRCRR